MSDITFLRDFSAQPAKPVEQKLAHLSASANDAMARAVGSTPLPVQSRSHTKVESPLPTEKYSNVSVDNKQAEPSSDKSEVTAKEPVVTPLLKTEQKVEKFAYGVVGDVPPGYKAASSCCNCEFISVESTCTKHNFPISFNYGCSDFVLIGSDTSTEKFSNQVPEDKEKQGSIEPNLSPLDMAVSNYEPVLSLFADGELASLALDKVINRFTNRSDYADAFLRLKYRRYYEDKHGSLEGAYVDLQEDN